MAYKDPEAKKRNAAQYYLAHREVIIARATNWRKDNIVERKAYEADYNKKNAPRLKDAAAARYATDSVRIKARVKKRAQEKAIEIAAYQAIYRKKNAPKLKARSDIYYKEHAAEIMRKNSEYRKKHMKEFKVYQAQWQKENPDKINANIALRRAAKLQAVPPWLTKEQRKQINRLYSKARELGRQDGIQRHVDHIYPLRSKVVCGLHVPWNLQILTATENHKKFNKVIAKHV